MRRQFRRGHTGRGTLLLASILLVPLILGGSCELLDPVEAGDGETMSWLQFVLVGRLTSVLLVTDNQGDAAINQFSLTSNSKNYDVAITSSSMTFEVVDADLAHSGRAGFAELAVRFGRMFESSLHAHGQSTAGIKISQSYSTGQNSTLSGFHTATKALPSGYVFQSPAFVFPAIRPGTLALLKWHISEVRLGGTISDGTTTKPFDLNLPAFDVELIPTCDTSVSIGSQSYMYTIFRMHNLLKDTTDVSHGHILDEVFTSGGGTFNATGNAGLISSILTNSSRAFTFYGCQI